MKLEFFRQIFKNPQISNFMKICPVGAELFRWDRWTDGQADVTKLIITFWNFANAPKIRGITYWMQKVMCCLFCDHLFIGKLINVPLLPYKPQVHVWHCNSSLSDGVLTISCHCDCIVTSCHPTNNKWPLLLLHRALWNQYIVHSPTNALFIKFGKA